jgi:hypothetical protein
VIRSFRDKDTEAIWQRSYSIRIDDQWRICFT